MGNDKRPLTVTLEDNNADGRFDAGDRLILTEAVDNFIDATKADAQLFVELFIADAGYRDGFVVSGPK